MLENLDKLMPEIITDLKAHDDAFCQEKYEILLDKLFQEAMEEIHKPVETSSSPTISGSRRTLHAPLNMTFPGLESIPQRDGIYLVSNRDQIKQIINYARQNKVIVRAVGAQHSVNSAIFANDSTKFIHIHLFGDLRKITNFEVVDNTLAYATVGAGCYLGVNPSDSASNLSNSFNYQIDQKGYALPILGGMSHQSVAGFLQTGSAGGSVMHGFGDVVEEIELIDGNGNEVTLVKGTDEFNAAVVSMGLYGIVVAAKLKLVERYLVKGTEVIVDFKDSFIANSDQLRAELNNDEFMHVNWFAQKYLNRVLEFKAVKVPHSADEQLVPYNHQLKSKFLNLICAAILKVANFLNTFDSDITRRLMALLLGILVKKGDFQQFCDHWYNALPVDDQALIDTYMDTAFTEVWLPISKTSEVMAALHDMLAKDPSSAGNFAIEIYSAKAAPFWLSAAFERDVIRVDPYWWKNNAFGQPEDFFSKYWNRLLQIEGARLHWGKYIPKPGQKFGDVIFGINYLNNHYANFSRWQALRAKFDPEQIFVNNYWRQTLGIPTVNALTHTSEASNNPPARTLGASLSNILNPAPVMTPKEDLEETVVAHIGL